MRSLLFFILLLQPFFILAQPFATDTIEDPLIVIANLRQSIYQAPNDPLPYLKLAQRKNQLSQYDSAIYFSNKCMSLLLTNKNDLILAGALHAKGNAQYYLDDKLKAEENWRHALQLSVKENDSNRIIKMGSNLGAIYIDRAYLQSNNKALYKTADSFLFIAYNTMKRFRTEETIDDLLTLRLIATSFHFQKKYDSADVYYHKVIKASKGNAGVYTGALSFYADALKQRGRYDEALKVMQEAIQVMNDSSLNSKDKTHLMHEYGDILFSKGDYKGAYHFIDSSYKLLVDDYKKINAAAYAESESKFKNQLLQYQVELERQKKNKLYFLIGGLIMLVALFFLWLRSSNSKRIAKEKAKQKQISIEAFIEGEEKEKIRIGRELHDGIAQEIVAVKLAMEQKKADAKLIQELARISLDIRNISHELMPQTLKEYGLKLAVEDICQKILAPSGIRYEVHSSLPEERMANKIEITLYRIFQELVHNIIKHSQATEVLVQLRKMNNHILLMVEDNGKGMTEEKNKGIGISNLKSRVQLLDGNLQYDSSENEGTTAIIRVPV